MSELRECPFCGLPLTIEEGQIGGYVLQHQARSEECPLATNIDGACAPVQLIYSNKKVLETVLNTRPLEDTLRADLARLRELLGEESDNLQNTLGLVRTSLPPMLMGLTEQQWLFQKNNRVAGELSDILSRIQSELKEEK